MNSGFEIQNADKINFESKKHRASLIKILIKGYESSNCDNSKIEIDKLKEEQYELAREM
jgi:hypothetical protein